MYFVYIFDDGKSLQNMYSKDLVLDVRAAGHTIADYLSSSPRETLFTRNSFWISMEPSAWPFIGGRWRWHQGRGDQQTQPTGEKAGSFVGLELDNLYIISYYNMYILYFVCVCVCVFVCM